MLTGKPYLALIGTMLIGMPAIVLAELDAKKLFQQNNASVVVVMSFDRFGQPLAIGSGFYIGDGTAIATNYHVIQGAGSVRVRGSEGLVSTIDTVLAVDPARDLALLESQSRGSGLRLSPQTPDIGEAIIAIGNPSGLERTLSKGIVSGIRSEDGTDYYQITAPISPGSSGGPIINESGLVIGVATFYIRGGQNLNFAMPSKYVLKLLDSPMRQPLAAAVGTVASAKLQPAGQDVSVEGWAFEFCDTLAASVVNRSDATIRNVRLVILFWEGSGPRHYITANVRGPIPSGTAVRFSRKDKVLSGHASNRIENVICIDKKTPWTATFRVLDYEMDAATLPIFQ